MPTPELETAEQLVESLCAHVVGRYPDTGIYVDTPPMAALIEARDAAVARRVLDEVRASAFALDDSGLQFTWREALLKAIGVVECKYAEPSGRKEE